MILSKHGVVTNETGLEDAKKNKRVYSNPIVLKAKSIYGKKNSDLVLDENSIKTLNNVDKILLKEAKILILVGQIE